MDFWQNDTTGIEKKHREHRITWRNHIPTQGIIQLYADVSCFYFSFIKAFIAKINSDNDFLTRVWYLCTQTTYRTQTTELGNCTSWKDQRRMMRLANTHAYMYYMYVRYEGRSESFVIGEIKKKPDRKSTYFLISFFWSNLINRLQFIFTWNTFFKCLYVFRSPD